MIRLNLFLVSLACVVSLTLVTAKQRKLSWIDKDVDTNGYNTAILVAGSNGYENYRHQADICHVYHMLKKKGMTDDDIILFIYDDIAYHPRNPFPGQIYNVPGGYDVYPGCTKDYTGNNVNKDVLTAVLKGDAAAVKGKGSGRVLKKDPNQRVLFVYDDHGTSGFLPFPVGDSFYADELNKLLIELRQKSMFKEMLVYVEACYSGAMFHNMPIKDEDKIFVVTAANPSEPSYATYCPYAGDQYEDKINPNWIMACMGDLFTVSWIKDAESRNVFETTLATHVQRVTDITSDGTYWGGSHVCTYGDKLKRIIKEKLGVFLSRAGYAIKYLENFGTSGLKTTTKGQTYAQTNADLMHFYLMASQNNDTDAFLRLQEEIAMRKHTDEVIYNSPNSLIRSGHLEEKLNQSSMIGIV